MLRIISFLIVIASVLGSTALNSETIKPIPLVANESAQDIRPYVGFINGVQAKKVANTKRSDWTNIERVTSPSIQFGRPGNRTLVLISLENISTQSGHWILTTGRGSLKYFEMYRYIDGEPNLIIDGQSLDQVKDNLHSYQAFSTEVNLAPREKADFAIYFEGENSTFLPLKVQTFSDFFKARRSNIAMVASVVSGMIILIIFSVIIYTVTGRPEFAWLGIAELFYVLTILHGEGYTTIYLLYEYPKIHLGIGDIFKCGFTICMSQFARLFIQTKKNFAPVDKILLGLICVSLALIAAQFIVPILSQSIVSIIRLLSWSVTGIVALILPFVAIAATRKVDSSFWPLIISWSSMALYIIYAAIASTGFFSNLVINWHLSGPVGLFEATFATIAMGLHLRKLNHQRVLSEQQLSESLAERLVISEKAQQLLEDNASARAAMQDQNNLIHASGHDSRQVLAALNAIVEVGAQTSRSKPRIDTEILNILKSSAAQLNDILSTTISAPLVHHDSKQIVALGHYRLSDILYQLQMIYRSLISNKNLNFTVDCDDSLYLITDRSLLVRALSNLLSNALKYTHEGSIEVKCSVKKQSLSISVIDSGVGMNSDQVSALMSQPNNVIRLDDKIDGTGSGIRSVLSMVDALKGRVVISSRQDHGTNISILLPGPISQVGDNMKISVEALSQHFHSTVFVDIDQWLKTEISQELFNVKNDSRNLVVISFDASSQTRSKVNGIAQLLLIKPLVADMTKHPSLMQFIKDPPP